ncbi:hypothetical protein R3P38DRAFT_3283626 [Favolaschia claudopus]|uniref:Uncharacterized protein n=1 Tax=Favolaschia claudopus TaxID=2862362 RepID=A0AAW0A7N2_9AGAR
MPRTPLTTVSDPLSTRKPCPRRRTSLNERQCWLREQNKFATHLDRLRASFSTRSVPPIAFTHLTKPSQDDPLTDKGPPSHSIPSRRSPSPPLSTFVVAPSRLRRTFHPPPIKSATSPLTSPSRPVPSPGDALDIPQPRSPRLGDTMRQNSLPHRTMSLPLSERTTLKLTFFKVKSAPPPRFPMLFPTQFDRHAERQSMQTRLVASSALPFSTSSPFDVDNDPRLNAHASHPLAPSSKSASFTTTADLARYVVLNTLDDFPLPWQTPPFIKIAASATLPLALSLMPRHCAALPSSHSPPLCSPFTPSSPLSTPAQAVTDHSNSDNLDTPYRSHGVATSAIPLPGIDRPGAETCSR